MIQSRTGTLWPIALCWWPGGLAEMTSTTWIVSGQGQIRGSSQVRLSSMFHLLAEEAKRQMSAPSVAFGLVAFGVLAFGLYVVLRQDVDK